MRALVLSALLLLSVAPAATAQQQRACNLIESRQVTRGEEFGFPKVYIQGPFLFRCEDGTELRAEQGTLNELVRELHLVGNVHFEDPAQTLTAQEATYNSGTGRLYATGDVVFTNRAEGSTIRGPELEYYRASAGRPEAQVTARQRPHLTLQPRDASQGTEPLEIDADQVMIFGQDRLHASGSVVITRPDLRATADDASYDAAGGTLDLRRKARIESDEFALSGQTIEARLAEGVLEFVHARNDAELVGEQLNVTAADLQLFFTDEQLQRAIAKAAERGEGETAARAVATSRNFRLEADSLDALLPGQQLEKVIAVGDARGESTDTAGTATAAVPADSAVADSTLLAALALIDRDWIVGDTIIGFFAPGDSAAPTGDVAQADTAVVLRRIEARGAAQSLYRVRPQNAEAAAGTERSVNYLSGLAIELSFEEGELELAEVTGLRKGLYLDPVPAAGQGGVPEPAVGAAPAGSGPARAGGE